MCNPEILGTPVQCPGQNNPFATGRWEGRALDGYFGQGRAVSFREQVLGAVDHKPGISRTSTILAQQNWEIFVTLNTFAWSTRSNPDAQLWMQLIACLISPSAVKMIASSPSIVLTIWEQNQERMQSIPQLTQFKI
jgi:hypothetical protein